MPCKINKTMNIFPVRCQVRNVDNVVWRETEVIHGEVTYGCEDGYKPTDFGLTKCDNGDIHPKPECKPSE